MSYDNQNINTSSGAGHTSTFTSGGLNNSTGREVFEDSTSTFAPTGAAPQALAGNLHEHGHHSHGEGLHSTTSSTGYTGTGVSSGLNNDHHLTSGSNSGSGLAGVGSGLGHQHPHSDLGRGDHLRDDTRGDIKAGTAYDPAVGEGNRTGSGLTGGVVGQQTGDVYGGVQTGSGSFGTGRHVQQDENKGLLAKAKDAVTGGNNNNNVHDDDYNRRTVGHGAHVGTGLTSNHPGAGITGAAGTSGRDNTYGSDNAARDYDNRTSGLTGSNNHNIGSTGLTGSHDSNTTSAGVLGSHDHTNTITGIAGSRDHGVTNSTGLTDSGTYGHSVGNKDANDHKLSGLTRHGDDFTRGDTADSAYKNYDATGLTGRETTTTGVHDNNLQNTGAHKEGIMDKVKNIIGGHKNTTHADTTHAETKH